MPRNISLLCRNTYKLKCGITLHIPTVGEIKGENDDDLNEYYGLITPFISTPTDFMVELYDSGIDFQTIKDEYEFFITLLVTQNGKNYHLLFEGAEEIDWRVLEDPEKKEIYVFDIKSGIIINREAYDEISDALRQMHYKEKSHIECCNRRALDMVVKIEKKKRRIAQRDKSRNELDSLILFLVNNSNFKYDFATVKNLSIYDFLSSSKQILKNDHVDKILAGGYSGGIDLSKIPKTELDKFKLN